MLLLTLLPLASWAASGDAVKVGDKTVYLSSRFITGTTAPEFIGALPEGWTAGEGVYAYDATNKKYVAATIAAGDFGTFFLKMTKDGDVLYVPFQKGVAGVQSTGTGIGTTTDPYTPNDFAYIYDEASWNLSYNAQNGGLNAYYAWADGGATKPYKEDMWKTDPGRPANGSDGGSLDENGYYTYPGCVRNWLGALKAPGAKYPWIVMNPRTNAVRPLFKYNYGDIVTDEPSEVWPWGIKAIKNFGCASVAEEFQNNSFLLPETNYAGNNSWQNTKDATCAFDITKFSVDLFPEIAAFALAQSVVYNGDNTQGPGFSLAGYNPEVLGVSVEATIVNDKTGQPVENINGVGTYYYSINFYETTGPNSEKVYKLTTPIKSTTFDVTGKRVVINAARTSKKYGEADPKPNWAFDWASSLASGDTEADITNFLVFKRSTGNEGEDVREYSYYIDYSPEYQAGECDYEIVILQNTSLMVIEPLPIDIYVTDDTKSKKYNGAEPAFKYVKDNALLSQLPFDADKTKANGVPSATDLIASITREVGEAVGDDTYAFTATAYTNQYGNANYIVNVKNKFSIVPTDQTGGVTVTFDPASFVYKGEALTPDPIVKDGQTPLTVGVDYDIDTEFDEDGYKDNKNAGTATCQIKLKGNYVATGDASKKQGTFTITKKALTVYAISYEAEPANGYEVEYNGFVQGENATNAAGFTTPAAPIVSKGASIEQDVYALVIKKEGWAATNYEITPKDGILALNNKTIIYAYPDPKTQEYTGTVDKELTFATYTSRNHAVDTKMESNPVTAVLGQAVYVIAKEDPTNANVGAYDITLRGATVLKDYTVVYDDLADGYEITRKLLTLKAIDASKIYGDADPTFDALAYDGETAWTREQMNAVGIINNGPNNTGYYVGCGNWRNNRWNHGENVDGGSNSDGTYPITVGLHSRVYGNYEITETVNGKFTINKFAAKITADNKTKQFGQADPEFTVTITDNNNAQGHTIGTAVSNAFVSELASYWEPTRPDAGTEAGEAKGEHAIVVAAPKVDEQDVKPNNFTLTFVNGTLTITPAQIAVYAKDQYVEYALDYNKKINPYDVIVVTPTEILEWQKSTQVGLSDVQKAINEKIKGLVKLTVKEGKNKLGGNEDAFVPNILSDDYELATEDVVVNDDVVYGGATIKNGFKNGWLTIYALETIPLDNAELAELLGEEPDEAGTKPSLLQKVLKAHAVDGVRVNVKMPARKMDADQWYTWVLPFRVDPETIFDRNAWGYGALETLDANQSKGNKVVFALRLKEIAANTPFITKVKNDISADKMKGIVIPNVALDNTIDYLTQDPTTGDAGNVQFVGLYYDKKGFTAEQKYNAAVKDKTTGELGDRMFYPGGEKSGSIVVKRTNAYLQFPSAASAQLAKIYIQEEDGTYTAINGVEADTEATDAEGIYNLSGQRVNKAQKGIYIVNGKKVLVK